MAVVNLQELLGGKPLDPEEAMIVAKKQTIEANKRYMRFIEATLKFIDELDPKDRLDFAFGIQLIVNALHGSVKGWEKWCALRNMRAIKDEEFKDIYPKMKKIMTMWLKIDLEITDAKTKEIEAELEALDDDEGKSTRGKPSKEASKLYVA